MTFPMCHLSRSVCAALFGTLLCIRVHRSSSLKVLRDSEAENLTYESFEALNASLQADSAIRENAMRGAMPATVRPHGAPLPFPAAAEKLAMIKQVSSWTIDTKTMTRIILITFLSLLCIGLVLGYTEKAGEETSSPDLSRSSMGHYNDPRDLKRPALLVTEGHDGDWSKKYRAADRTQKQALDLLYQSNIIPDQEFLHAKVSQDHIDECIWIANAMLKQQTMREWLDSGEYAREYFHSCVTALFEARSDIKDTQKYESPEKLFGGSSPENRVVKERVPLNRIGTNMLLDRCREIMAETKRDSIPKSTPRTETALDLQSRVSTNLDLPREHTSNFS